ncbi:MAG: HYR domain-containing protein [Actinomycetota bacterium]
MRTSPIGSIPIGSIPIGSIPIGSIPIGSIPIGSIPIGSIDLADSPIGSIPIGSIPAGSLDTVVDCSLIDCDADFTLLDALAAGALRPAATLAVFEGVRTGVRLTDLVGVDGLDTTAIQTQVDSINSIETLSQLLTFDDLDLSDMPVDLPEMGEMNIGLLGGALATVTLQDLVDALGASASEMSAELQRKNLFLLTDLPNHDGMTLGDLPSTLPQFRATQVGDLLAAMSALAAQTGASLRLGDLLALHPSFDPSDVDWGTGTLADVSNWFEVELDELDEYDSTTLAQLVGSLPPSITDELTLGEILLSLVGRRSNDWSEVRLGAIDLEATSGAQTFTSSVQVVGGLGFDRTVTIRSTLPDDAVYAEGSTVIRAVDAGSLPGGAGEPTIEDNQLVWTLSGIRTGVRYEIDIDVVPALSLGSSTVSTEGSILGAGVSATGLVTVGVDQAFEPNDAIGDSGLVDAASDTIYASHVGEAGDIDLFTIDLQAGDRLTVSLSDLPADYDLVVYGPPTPELAAPPLRQLDPSELPEIDLDPDESDEGGAVLQDVPLLDLPVVGVSTNRDLESETIEVASVRTAGTYHVQVNGYSDANSPDPYALFVQRVAGPAPAACLPQDYQSIGDRGTVPTIAEMAGVNALIVANRERLVGKYGAVDAQVALDALDDMVEYTNVTDPGLGLTTAIVFVDGDDDVRSAYDALDANACDPAAANGVVASINDLLDEMRAADPDTEIEQIMIVGDDDVVPMARLADETTIANERTYATTFVGTNANSLFGAFSTGHYLSDDPYADVDPVRTGDRILYVPDAGLGRVVERPAEIAGQIATFISFQGQLDPSTALVTGYDFLQDGAQAVVDALEALPDTTTVEAVINETWTADDVIDQLFPLSGDAPNIASINAHFDHHRALPADQNAAGIEDDLFTTADVDDASRDGRLAGRALFSMGCHGGLSVPDELFPGVVDGEALDWAQVYARQGAVWVGNTGYGYGETEGVELTERLMALYAARLDGSVTVGEALYFAKQEYLGTQQATYGAFDEKVLQQATFYGIPFYGLAVADAPDPAPVPAAPATIPVLGALSIEASSISAEPTFTPVLNPGDGTSYEASIVGDGVETGDQSTPFSQIQPTATFDVSNVSDDGTEAEQVAQGAIITHLVTTDVTGVDPDLARPIVDDSGVEVEPDVRRVASDPGVFVSSYDTPEGPRQSLTALLGTFRSTADDGSGTQRLYDEIDFDVYYRDPSSITDQSPPTFRSIRSTVKEISGADDVLVISVSVTDDTTAGAGAISTPSAVVRVLALVATDPGAGTEWEAVELQPLGADRWGGASIIGGTDVEYILQAVDANGNVALTTNKSAGFAAATTDRSAGTIDVTSDVPTDVILTGPVEFMASAGGEIVDHQVDGGEIVVGAGSSMVTLDPASLGDGVHFVTFTTERGDLRTEVVVFDTDGPDVVGIVPAPGSAVPEGEPVTVDFDCTDAATGVSSCTATLDGAPVSAGDTSTLPPGTYSLVVTAVDGLGRSSTSTTTFTVSDVTAPVIVTPPLVELRVDTDPGEAFATVTYTVTATDGGTSSTIRRNTAVTGQLADDAPAEVLLAFDDVTRRSAGLVVECTPPSGSRFPIGTTQVTCTATDASGNEASASFEVVVTDAETPSGPADVPDQQVTINSVGDAVSFDPPVITDNSGDVTITCNPAPGTPLPAGDTTVTCTAVDPSGNETVITFVVSVQVDPAAATTTTTPAAPPTTAPPPDPGSVPLPATGNRGLPLMESALVLALGIALVVLARRRRRLHVTTT